MPEGVSDPAIDRRDRLYRRLLALADVFAAGLALFVGVSVLGSDSLTPVALLALPVAVVVAKAIRLYDRDEALVSKTTLDEAPALES